MKAPVSVVLHVGRIGLRDRKKEKQKEAAFITL